MSALVWWVGEVTDKRISGAFYASAAIVVVAVVVVWIAIWGA